MDLRNNSRLSQEDEDWFPIQVTSVKQRFEELPEWMKRLAQREMNKDIVSNDARLESRRG
jgi:hypothetical protein